MRWGLEDSSIYVLCFMVYLKSPLRDIEWNRCHPVVVHTDRDINLEPREHVCFIMASLYGHSSQSSPLGKILRSVEQIGGVVTESATAHCDMVWSYPVSVGLCLIENVADWNVFNLYRIRQDHERAPFE